MNPAMANYQSVPRDFSRGELTNTAPVPPNGCVASKLDEIEKLAETLADRIGTVLRPAPPSLCSALSGPGPSHVWGKLCQIEDRLSDILGRIEL